MNHSSRLLDYDNFPSPIRESRENGSNSAPKLPFRENLFKRSMRDSRTNRRPVHIKLKLSIWTDLVQPGYWKRSLLGIVIMFFQQFVGIHALIYYSPTLFGLVGLDYDMQLIMSGVLSIFQLVGITTSIFTMDHFGRRKLPNWGTLDMAVTKLVDHDEQ